MKTDLAQINLFIAWLWIALGFGSGVAMGLKFHDPNWLGGYASWPRRLYRLAHISFFGLAMVNLMFYFTAQRFAPDHLSPWLASWGFVLGALTMPLCCVIMAHFPKLRALFAIPVTSLIAGAISTLIAITTL